MKSEKLSATLTETLIIQSKEILKIKSIIRNIRKLKSKISDIRHPLDYNNYLDVLARECRQSVTEIEQQIGLLITPLVEPIGCGKQERFHLTAEELYRGYATLSKINSKNDDFVLPLSTVDNGLFKFTEGIIVPYPSTEIPLSLFKSVHNFKSFKINNR